MSEKIRGSFWACGEITGGELRLSVSTGGLLASFIEGYGELGRAETIVEGGSWADLLRQNRYAYACDVATEYQARALAEGSAAGTWSQWAEEDSALQRLTEPRCVVPSSEPWTGGRMRLVVVHPVIKALDWEPPRPSRSLIVIDPRTEIDLLLSLRRLGALTSTGSLTARSRVAHPYGM
ncbi:MULTISPECIES: hypothetical protein [unclassified Cryobacterium]|uniref:hypothetical protein n=1 Tax=unclassified Cryobacterium TaxID=2649013 RepID=UPI002B234FBF|nr:MULTISPECIES: hypothetical protein [Cryobacterium]MEB0303881.1 hypothetical protein [Cryobacterium sp. 10I1]MEC5148727.1 hypothetical protein [Cryobacterium psychrotolerans]